ncbi:hypothetical protein V6N12_050826 [Hibiscus sabdariffa]|uniref:Uncharacterized protein n=1 Tax=Hibiscus sabdariffa TaxID=183260 RepID=A0ABR2GDI9_9ROSI
MNVARPMSIKIELDEDAVIVGGEGLRNTATGLARKVASTDVVVLSETSLNKEKHTVMRVGDELNVQTPKSKLGQVLPASIRGSNPKLPSKHVTIVKSDQRQSLKVKQNVDRG